MGVRQENMIYTLHLGQGEISNTGARIDEKIRVNEERRGSAVFGDCA
jgi:hypothetical protein